MFWRHHQHRHPFTGKPIYVSKRTPMPTWHVFLGTPPCRGVFFFAGKPKGRRLSFLGWPPIFQDTHPPVTRNPPPSGKTGRAHRARTSRAEVRLTSLRGMRLPAPAQGFGPAPQGVARSKPKNARGCGGSPQIGGVSLEMGGSLRTSLFPCESENASGRLSTWLFRSQCWQYDPESQQMCFVLLELGLSNQAPVLEF